MVTEMNNSNQLGFLLTNCGPIIKHLLLTETNDTKSETFKKNYTNLLNLPEILYWKQKIPTRLELTTLLGSNDLCFENSFGKLLSYGLKTDDILSKTHLDTYLSFLTEKKCENIYDSIAQYTVAGYLFASGLSHDIVDGIIERRINSLFKFITNSPYKFNIYTEVSDFNIPAQYKSKKLVNPVLYQDNELTLPLIYDIFIFYHIYDRVPGSLKEKIDTIIKYISDSRYQDLDYGYGLIKESRNKLHFMGWSAHLPFANKKLSTDYFEKGLIHRLVLFSKFNDQNIQKWIRRMLIKLDVYKLDNVQYCFPNELIPEVKNSYFMNGRHTGLGENRRMKIGKIVESTYYMYKTQN